MIDTIKPTEDGQHLVRVADRWFLADRVKRGEPGSTGDDMVRIDDHWFLAKDLVAA